MACIARGIDGTAQYWTEVIQDAVILRQDEPVYLGWRFPANGEPGWGIRNIYNGDGAEVDVQKLIPAQRRALVPHVREDASCEKWKIAGLIIGAIALSVLTAGAVLFIASLAIEGTIGVFGVILPFLNGLMGENVVVLIVASLTLGATLAYEMFTAVAATLALVAMLWTKEFLPNILRGFTYVNHLAETVRRLEYLGA